jgi:hypothetical protein
MNRILASREVVGAYSATSAEKKGQKSLRYPDQFTEQGVGFQADPSGSFLKA